MIYRMRYYRNFPSMVTTYVTSHFKNSFNIVTIPNHIEDAYIFENILKQVYRRYRVKSEFSGHRHPEYTHDCIPPTHITLISIKSGY